MLIMKTFYTEMEYQLDQMMYFYAGLTIIMHIQTFFFTPITVVPKNQDLEGYSVFENVSLTMDGRMSDGTVQRLIVRDELV